jgi:hypothetical protein
VGGMMRSKTGLLFATILILLLYGCGHSTAYLIKKGVIAEISINDSSINADVDKNNVIISNKIEYELQVVDKSRMYNIVETKYIYDDDMHTLVDKKERSFVQANGEHESTYSFKLPNSSVALSHNYTLVTQLEVQGGNTVTAKNEFTPAEMLANRARGNQFIRYFLHTLWCVVSASLNIFLALLHLMKS